MKRFSVILTTLALAIALSVTACTDSLTGPDYEEFEQAAPVQTLDARHNFDPAANGDGGDLDRPETHNRIDEDDHGDDEPN